MIETVTILTATITSHVFKYSAFAEHVVYNASCPDNNMTIKFDDHHEVTWDPNITGLATKQESNISGFQFTLAYKIETIKD